MPQDAAHTSRLDRTLDAAPPFKVAQIRVGEPDSVGRIVQKVYARRSPDFVVYDAGRAVHVHYADDPGEDDKQRKALAPLSALRHEIGAAIQNRPDRDRFAVRVAEALVLALGGEAVGAERTLELDKAELDKVLADERAANEAAAAKVIAYKATVGRVWYVGTAVICGMALMAVLFALSHRLYPELRASVAQNVWLAAKAGLIGAWLSIAVGVFGRTLGTDGAWHTIAVDSALRMTLGAVCGGLLMLMVSSGAILNLKIELDGVGWMAVFLLGVVAGFSERLVPDALSVHAANVVRAATAGRAGSDAGAGGGDGAGGGADGGDTDGWAKTAEQRADRPEDAARGMGRSERVLEPRQDQLLVAFYAEHCEQARQHETLRAQAANLIFVVAVAILAIIADGGLNNDDKLLCGMLVPLGAFGVLLINAHYRKNRFHVNVAKITRNEYEKPCGRNTDDLRKEADMASRNKSRIQKEWLDEDGHLRIWRLWQILMAMVSIVGIVLLTILQTR